MTGRRGRMKSWVRVLRRTGKDRRQPGMAVQGVLISSLVGMLSLVAGIALLEDDRALLAGPDLSDDQDLGALRLVQVPEQRGVGQKGGVDQG